jgi:hypothetical protein
MWWDTKYNPTEHGDIFERQWWRLLEKDFDEWGIFWRHHVVPLTNRVTTLPEGSQRWYFFRRDSKINHDIEFLAMANYSVFYYLARTSLVIGDDSQFFPEDAFMFLRAACENAVLFIKRFTEPVTVGSTPLSATLGIDTRYRTNIPVQCS